MKVHALTWGDRSKGQSDDDGRLIEGPLERNGQPTAPYGHAGSASGGNAGRDGAAVSKGHSRQTLTVMSETRRRAALQRAGRSRKARPGDEPDRGSLKRRRFIARPALDINPKNWTV